MSERNRDHLQWIYQFTTVEVGWIGSEDLTEMRRSATRRKIPFCSIAYESIPDLMVLAPVSRRTIGHPYESIVAFRNVLIAAIDYRQRSYSGNKYSRVEYEPKGFGGFTIPGWATEKDAQYILTALGYRFEPDGVHMPAKFKGMDVTQIVEGAFRAYNSGTIDEFLVRLEETGCSDEQPATRRAGSWDW